MSARPAVICTACNDTGAVLGGSNYYPCTACDAFTRMIAQQQQAARDAELEQLREVFHAAQDLFAVPTPCSATDVAQARLRLKAACDAAVTQHAAEIARGEQHG